MASESRTLELPPSLTYAISKIVEEEGQRHVVRSKCVSQDEGYEGEKGRCCRNQRAVCKLPRLKRPARAALADHSRRPRWGLGVLCKACGTKGACPHPPVIAVMADPLTPLTT
jgi:hypothetical protein